MVGFRLLNTGRWNKPPVLTSARSLLIEALGRHVTSKPLGEMAAFVNGTSYRNDLLAEGGTPIIRISNITDPRSTFLGTRESFEGRYRVESGDLLVSWSASFKSIIWPGPSGVLNQHIFRVRERDGNDKNFIRHAIEAVFDAMQEKVVGIGMMHLRRQDFLGHEVPCPKYEIQRAVSSYLDWIESGSNYKEPSLPDFLDEQRRLVSRIQELYAKVEQARGVRRQTEEETEALFGGGLDAVVKPLSQNYETHTLISMVEEDRGISYGVVLTGVHDDNGVPTLRAGDLQKFRVNLTNVKKIDPTTEAKYRRTHLRGNELLLRIRGGLGELAVCPPEMVGGNVSREIAVIPFTDRVLPKFGMYVLAAPTSQVRMRSHLRGTSYVGINLKDVRTLPMPVPPVPEQQKIVADLDLLRAKVDTLKKLQSETAAELDALIPSILSKAFSGEL
jgi:restriction endonuclease S subunit